MATAVESAPPPVVEPAKAPAATMPAASPPVTQTPPPAAPAAPAPVAKVETAPASLLADPPKADAPADKAPAEKPADKAPDAPAVEWKLEAPKDSGLTPEHLKAVEDFAKPLGLTPAQAQKMVERDAATKAAQAVQAKAEYAKQYDTWAAAAKAEFGAKLPEVTDSAKRFLRTYDTTGELSAMLKSTPYGNFAPLMRVLAAAGNVLREDAPAAGNTNAQKPVDPVKAFYGDDHRKPSTKR